MNLVRHCNRIIEFSFYALFFLVPLFFWGSTSELFEFNKMWVTFGITIIIAAAWFTKMTVEKRIVIQKTPLDIFLLLFLLSQIISTIFSLDSHVSWWGYYSRFNGGLLSTLCYIFLYYAFVSNLSLKHVLKTLSVSLVTGFIVALWGFPSHFGADPTCLLFRGSLDTSCWTDAFKPTIRAFSTLGQPAWYAAYLAVLIPITIAYALRKTKSGFWIYFGLAIFFYINFIFADTRTAYGAVAAEIFVLWGSLYYLKSFPVKILTRFIVIFIGAFLICNFLFGSPVLNKLTVPGIAGYFNSLSSKPASPAGGPAQPAANTSAQTAASPVINSGITDSGKIRLIVWKGALDAWLHNPIFGTGVETFAFAYYQYRPVEHNLTSEWDYLYNKAHNEYLNYLATTGLFGLATYLSIIGIFMYLFIKYILEKNKTRSDNEQNRRLEYQREITYKNLGEFRSQDHDFIILQIGLVAGWISILITNFGGFSVVIMNLYLFLIPAFVFILQGRLDPEKLVVFPFGNTSEIRSHRMNINPYQWTIIGVLIVFSFYLLIGLSRYWYADVEYALGANLDRSDAYQQAYPLLVDAANIEPNEPVYLDELSVNLGTLGAATLLQKNSSEGGKLVQQAIDLSNHVTQDHPNNVVYWKNRVRLYYTLAQSDPANQQAYSAEALKSIQKANSMAPTDAKISYNLGVLYDQVGDRKDSIKTLKLTTEMKPDYLDAYTALGVVYHEASVDKNGKIIDPGMHQNAIKTYQFILAKLSPNNDQIKKSLNNWQKEN